MSDDRGGEETRRRRATGVHTAPLDRDALQQASGAHSADALPESPSVRVDLPPAPPPEMPEDEVAVAIDDVAVNPGTVVGSPESTTSVEVVTPALAGAGYRGGSRRDPSPYSALLAADASRLRRERVTTDTGSHVAIVDVPGEAAPGTEVEVPETSESLTADRLIDLNRTTRPAPQGGFNRFLYEASLHLVNLGDSAKVRAHKAMSARIQKRFEGGARFVPVLTRKGGVGKTTITALLGMALADARDDRIIAVDANPDRGTLAERVSRSSVKTVRDLVKVRSEVSGYNDISNIVARDETRLDVLASDSDPRVSEALNDRDYHDIASLAAHYYSIVLTDTGTGIVHSVMGATLDLADLLVVVAGLSVDEARLASETLTWLETNGYAELVRNAIVVLNTARPGTPLVRQDELEAHFRTRVRTVVRIPYDPHIAAGSAISFRDLQPTTRLAARDLAASVVEGLRSLTPAA